MTDLPDPLTPADCDLRGLPFLPIDTVRLLDSDFMALATAEEFKAGLTLWCKAWQQVPAASLPNDDRVLAHLSGAGPRWRRLKAMALRNWIECSDGRLYHPVVAEKALEALPRRQAFRDGKSAEAARKQREREERQTMFERLRAAGVSLPWNTKTAELRTQTADLSRATGGVTGVTGHGLVTAKTGTGTGTIPPNPLGQATPASDPFDPDAPLARVVRAAGMSQPPGDRHLLAEWLALPDMQLERDVLPLIERKAQDLIASTGRAPFKLQFFDPIVREHHRASEAKVAALRRGRERLERLAAGQGSPSPASGAQGMTDAA